MTTRMGWVLLAVAAAACGKGKDKAGGAGGGAAVTAADVAKVNAAVPAAWKGKLEFAPTTIDADHTTFSVAAPKGWKKGFMPGELEPADATKDMHDSATFGFAVSMSVGSDCGGACEPKDWAKVADKTLFKQFYDGRSSAKVVKDDKQPTRRVVVADGANGKAYVIVAWWKDGSDHYWSCTVDLARDSHDLAAAFEQACLTARVQ